MTIEELEETYRQLHERLLNCELDEDSFKTQVEQLRFEDEQGNRWKIGWYTGQWYRYDQGQWIQGQPGRPAQAAPSAAGRPAAMAGDQTRSTASWLAPLLIGLLALAGLTLAIGWYEDWWSSPAGSDVSAVQASPEASSTPVSPATATVLPATATALPASATISPATSTSAVSSQPTAMAMATGRPTNNPASTATPSATEVPADTPTALPAATASAQSSPAASASAAPVLAGRIFFPVYDLARQTFDIYVVDLASGEKTLVVQQASQPAISPNDERLAYRSWRRDSRGILVQDMPQANTWTWVNYAEAARPSWSPDSKNIVLASQQEPDRQWRLYYTIGLDLNHLQRNGGDIPGRVPTWLHDNRIVYWECPLNQCGLYAMQSDGTSPVRLTTYENDTTPAGSPDSSQIAFMSNRDGNWEIYLATTQPAGQLQARRLTRNSANDGLPTWSPNGRWIAFVTDRNGPWAVWAMRSDGSDQHQLFALGGSLEGKIALVTDVDQSGWTWESIAWGR